MKLSGKQLENLENALIDAFLDKASLERMLLYKLDKNLNQVAGGSDLATVVFNLIKVANAEGWIKDLVCKASQYNSGNQLLQAIATELRANNLTPTPYNSSKEDAIAEYRLKVKEFAEDVEITYGESEILKDLQKKLKLTEEEVRTIRDEVLEPFGRYRENLDKYRQVFTKWVDEQGYPFKEKAKADLKKLQEHYQLKDEDIALLFKEAEQQEAEKLQRQQEAAERLRQEQEKAEYQAKLQRYKQELSKAINVAYPLNEYARNGLKSFQQFLGLLDEDVALVEQSVIAPKESGYRRQLETERLKPQQLTNNQDTSACSEFGRNLAFVIGINNYKNGISHLNTAVNDAKKLVEVLRSKHKYQAWVCLDSVATLSNLNKLLEETLPAQVTEQDRLLFYFAGHGVALNSDDDPAGYLIPQDAKLGDTNSYLPMTKLHDALSKLPCRHFLGILDCCFAGAFRWSSTRDLITSPEVIYQEHYDRFIRDAAWQIITSSASDQKALDNFNLGTERGQVGNHSPFAAALLEALEGAADTYPPAKNGQQSGDGVITATELYLYLRDRIEIPTEKYCLRQTPGIWCLNKHDKGEYIFLSPSHELNLPLAPLDEGVK